MKRKCTFLMAAFALLVFMMPIKDGWGQTRDSYSHEYGYSALKELLPANGNWSDAGTYIKIPSASGGSESFTIPIDADKQPTGDISLTFEIATFGSGNAQTASTTTITAVGTEANSTWSGSGVSSYPSSATYVNGTMTIAVPSDPTTLEGLNVTMGVNTGIRIFRLRTLTIEYTYDGGGTPQPTTYTVTFDVGNGTFDGNNDFPELENEVVAGSYTLPSAHKDGFTFTGWMDDFTEYEYAGGYTFPVIGDVSFTAQYTESTTPPGPIGDEEWVLTSFDELTSSDVFVIVGNNFAMTNNNGINTAPATVAVTVENGVITSTVDSNIQWTMSGNATDGYTFYPNGSTTTWLYCNTTANSSSNNNMRVGTGNRKVFELTNNILATKDTYVKRYLSIYNNQDWRGYVNTNLSPVISFYKKVISGAPTPSITAANVDIAYDATSGAIEYTINNPAEDGILTASTNDSWLTLGTVDTTVPFTCTANEGIDARTATVTLTYTYGENDETVTKEVTITQAGNPNVESITVNPSTVYVTAEGEEGNINVTYQNMGDDFAPVIYFYAEDGETSATYDWITIDFDANNNVHYVVEANQGAARMAYFKVVFDGAAPIPDPGVPFDKVGRLVYVYSNLVTISQEAYVAPPSGEQYVLFTGDLVEGDYLIVYNGVAMNNVVVSDRLQYENVTISDNTIITEDATIVWHIAPSGDYWTIYNADADAYAAGTGVKNKAQMLADGTNDMALWTATGMQTYEFVNKANTTAGVNANLRRNGTYGFACYGTGTGGALSLYKSSTEHLFVAAPTFSPVPGSYTEDQEVTISCSTQGAVIYYTLDGSEPTTESDVYAEPISVTEGITTIKAIAVLDTIVSRMTSGVYNINPYASGSFENPYTVQDAKDNTPSSGYSDYVYVRGIVSEIASTESDVIQYHDISYYISDDGSTANQLFVRYGMNIDSTEFYSLSELQVGDRVVVRGRLQKGTTTHSSSTNNPRLASYNYIVSLERDVEPPFFSPGSCMLTNDENAIVYIFSETYEAEIHYTMDGSDPTVNSLLFDEANPINLQGETGTITIKAIAYYEGMHSAITSATYRLVEPGTPGTMETPYTVQEILTVLDSVTSIDQVYVRGIVCTNPIIEEGIYHNANYYISDDGTAGEGNQLYVYRGKGLGGEPITSEDDLRKGDIVTVLGDLWIYHGVKEFKQYSIIYEWERPSSITVTSESADCGEKDGHLNVGYYNIYFQANPPRVQLCDEQGNPAEYDWLTVTLNGSELDFHINAAAEGDVPRTAYLKVVGNDWSGNEVVSNIASITQTECLFAPLPFRYAYEREANETEDQLLARLDSIPEGLEVVGLGEYYTDYPYLKFDAPNVTTGQQDYIKLAFNEEAARLTFDIRGDGFRGGYFYLQTSTDGLDWNIIAVYTTAELIAQMSDDNPLKPIAEVLNNRQYETKTFDNLSSDTRYLKWIYATYSSGNVRLGDIHLYTPADLYNIVLSQPEFDGCSISADKAIAVEGETVTLSYELAEDYTFVDWIVTDGNGGSVTVNDNQFVMPASNVTVAANIELIQRYNIVLNQPEFDGCSIYADKTVAAEGEMVTLSYELAEGYYFIEWNVTDGNGDAVAVNDNQFIMPNSMVTVEAVIVGATTEYQYVYSINGVETAPQTAIVGESITLDDGANIDAFEFIGWTIDPNDIENVMPAETSYTIMDDITFYAVYSHDVAKYVKVIRTGDLTNGNYLIVYEEASVAFNGGLATLDGVNNTISVDIEGGVIAADAATNAATFTIDVDNQTLQSASGYYIGVSSNSNGLKQSAASGAYHNSFAIDENGDAVISAVFDGSNMVLRFNAASNQNRFRYYGGSQKAIQLYKYVGSDLYTRVFVDNPEGAVAIAGPSIIPSGYVLNVNSITNELGADKLFIEEGGQLVTSNNVNATMRKTISAFQGDANDNYCFISTPVNNQDPAELGMVGGNYDLYYFDKDATDEEWQNYKVESFDLTTGMGYLYAKALGGTITVAGMMTNSGVGTTTLNGWYLIGNPYPCNVTINVPYYRLDESGAALVETDSNVAIAPMEGVLVYVEGETIVFTKAPQTSTVSNTGSKVVFKVKP